MSRSASPARWIVIGKVSRAHGVRGELRVVSSSDIPFPDGVTRLQLERGGRTTVWPLARVRPVHDAWLVTLVGVGDRDAAALLCGSSVSVDAAELPPSAADELYVFELEGARVVDEQGTVWGTVAGLLERPGQDLLRIAGARGELLLPFVAETVLSFDREARTLVVRPAPGLWEP